MTLPAQSAPSGRMLGDPAVTPSNRPAGALTRVGSAHRRCGQMPDATPPFPDPDCSESGPALGTENRCDLPICAAIGPRKHETRKDTSSGSLIGRAWWFVIAVAVLGSVADIEDHPTTHMAPNVAATLTLVFGVVTLRCVSRATRSSTRDATTQAAQRRWIRGHATSVATAGVALIALGVGFLAIWAVRP
jgi:hypothetical protein